MPRLGTDPVSYITECTLAYEDDLDAAARATAARSTGASAEHETYKTVEARF